VIFVGSWRRSVRGAEADAGLAGQPLQHGIFALMNERWPRIVSVGLSHYLLISRRYRRMFPVDQLFQECEAVV